MGRISFRKNQKGLLLLIVFLLLGAGIYYGDLGEISQEDTLSLIDQGRYLRFETQTGAVLTMRPATTTERLMYLLAITAPSSVDPGQSFDIIYEFNEVDSTGCKGSSLDIPYLEWGLSSIGSYDGGSLYIGGMTIKKYFFSEPWVAPIKINYKFSSDVSGGDYEIKGRLTEGKSGDTCYVVSEQLYRGITVSGDEDSCNQYLEYWDYMCKESKVYEGRDLTGDGCYLNEDAVYIKSCNQGCAQTYAQSANDLCVEETMCTTGEFRCVQVNDLAVIEYATSPNCDWLQYNVKTGTCRHGSGNSCDGSVSDCVVLASDDEIDDKEYTYWTIVGGQCVSTKSDVSSPPSGYYKTESLCNDALAADDDDDVITPPGDDEDDGNDNGGPEIIFNDSTKQSFYAVEDGKCVLKNEVVTEETEGWSIAKYGEDEAKALCEAYLEEEEEEETIVEGVDNFMVLLAAGAIVLWVFMMILKYTGGKRQ